VYRPILPIASTEVSRTPMHVNIRRSNIPKSDIRIWAQQTAKTSEIFTVTRNARNGSSIFAKTQLLTAATNLTLATLMLSSCGSKSSETKTSNSQSSLTVGKSFRLGTYGGLDFKIEKIELCDSEPKSGKTAPKGTHYVLLRYSVRNEGTVPDSIDSGTKFLLFVNEKPPIKYSSGTDVRGSGDEIQPGFGKSNLVATFLVPDEQLKKRLILDLYGDGADHRFDFQFDGERQPTAANDLSGSSESAQTQQGLDGKGGDIYTLNDDEIVFKSWQACDALQRNRLDSNNSDACDHLQKGAKVKVLERLGGDIAYVRVEVLSGSDTTNGSRTGWIPEKSLTQETLPTDQLAKRFNQLAKSAEGVHMTNPTFDHTDHFFCQVADNIDMFGEINSNKAFKYINITMSREYHGEPSVLLSRESKFGSCVKCLALSLSPALTAEGAQKLIDELGMTPGKFDSKNQTKSEKDGNRYTLTTGPGLSELGIDVDIQTAQTEGEQNQVAETSTIKPEPNSIHNSETADGMSPDKPESILDDSSPKNYPASPNKPNLRPVLNASSNNLIDEMIAAQRQSRDTALEEARLALDRVVKPTQGDAKEAEKINKLGLTQLRAKNFSQAASLFATATEIDPSDPKLFSNLGYAETAAGNLTAAEKHLRKSITLAPSRTVAWGDLGIVFAKSSRRDEAVAAFLIGNRFSKDDYTAFLRTLSTDEDSKVREAGDISLSTISNTAKAAP